MNKIGFWGWDGCGLPVYHYTGDYPAMALDRAGRDSSQPQDPCFILGNYRMTLFAHVSGSYELISGERGWARLNHCGRNTGFNRTTLCIADAEMPKKAASCELTGAPFAQSCVTNEVFGAGFARYSYSCPMGLEVVRELDVQPSERLHQGNASFLLTFTLKNTGKRPLTVELKEMLLANYRMMSSQEEQEGSDLQRMQYENTFQADGTEGLVTADISCRPAKLLVLPEDDKQSFQFDCFPPTLFLQVVKKEDWKSRAGWEKNADACGDSRGELLFGEAKTVLAGGEEKTLQMAVGFCFDKDQESIQAQIRDMLDKAEHAEGSLEDQAVRQGAYAQNWKRVLPEFEKEQDEMLRQEMIWNAYTLEAMATYNRYFQETYIPQGSVYAYHLGQNASNRDHLQHLLPMIYCNPALAKSCIRFAVKHTLENGEIKRQDIGYGYCDPGIYMESDAQIYMFMAVGEYLRLTGDYELLDEEISYYPVEHGKKDTVLGALIRHFIYLRDTVGRGRHGLVKMLNSDWSDSFFHPYSPNIYSLVAESHMNTTMVLAVLPALIEGLKAYSAGKKEQPAAELIDGLVRYRAAVYESLMKDMEGRSFAPRCYIGFDDDPALRFGEKTLCLEPQIFLLQMEDFPKERKEILWKEILDKNLSMEKNGARTREIPLWDKGGHGEDGGIWFSHQGGLIAGLATFNMQAAWELLRKLTFHRFAEEYPDYWLGHWTFADSLESTLSDREGLYHFWTEGAFQPFCAHAHAWMLYCYYKLKEMQSECTDEQ